MELLVYREKALVLRRQGSVLYPHLYKHLKDSHGDPDKALFARLLRCSDSEVVEGLGLQDRAKRVRGVAQQLYDGGFVMEAGSLLLASQSFHRELATLSDSLVYVKRLFSK